MASAGHGIFEPKTKLLPEVTVTGLLPTHPSSFNHENFDPAGVLRVASLLCTNLCTPRLLAMFPKGRTEP